MMTPSQELSMERFIIGIIGTLLTAGTLWLASSVQKTSVEIGELKAELRGLAAHFDRDGKTVERRLDDFERRIRSLESARRTYQGTRPQDAPD